MNLKKVTIVLCVLLLSFLTEVTAQIEKVVVETYYVTDSLDATDTTGGAIEKGVKTYRIFVDLKPGSKIRKVYGDLNHPLKISSTADFYNNVDRPNANFGYQISKNWFYDNPLIALDSWLTIGMATTVHKASLKADDIDGSIIGGNNNSGGSAAIPGGILVNADPIAGVALTSADGLTTNSGSLNQWVDFGFRNMANVDTTVFGPINKGNQFISTNAYLTQVSGVGGYDSASNYVLIAQLTTKGEISFELNLEVEEQVTPTTTQIVNYVATDTLLNGVQLSPYLRYPLLCGCTDPDYLEYSLAYGCSNQDACKTRIILGCTDTMACNYNSNANYHVQSLCCYPGHCDDRDISVVCPVVSKFRIGEINVPDIYPNPVTHVINLNGSANALEEVNYELYDIRGGLILSDKIEVNTGQFSKAIDVTHLENGLYMLRLFSGVNSVTKKIIKN